jgi:hypothetical protein
MTYRIELDAIDLGQILHGLKMRAESWERTAEYLRSGNVEDDYSVEECDNPKKADGIAEYYRSIITVIKRQMKAQHHTPKTVT